MKQPILKSLFYFYFFIVFYICYLYGFWNWQHGNVEEAIYFLNIKLNSYFLQKILLISKISWIIPIFYGLTNVITMLFFPPISIHHKYERHQELPSINKKTKSKIVFRYVTRGNNPKLIWDNISALHNNIGSKLNYHIEIVTDKSVLQNKNILNTSEIIVPYNYSTPGKSLFKARALYYAHEVSMANDDDWIIHLDEESYVPTETITEINHFILKEEELMRNNSNYIPAIGQGIIIYGFFPTNGFWNLFCTLADSIRVADDLGKFRLQFFFRKCLFGMKGSFMVVQNRIEKKIKMECGPKGSVTEDTWFALRCANMNIPFDFINGIIIERSPFSIYDFLKQRRRWFSGLWLVIFYLPISLIKKITLATMLVSWTFLPIIAISFFVSLLFISYTPFWLSIISAFTGGLFIISYSIGFFHNFPSHKYWLYPLQVLFIPLFMIAEASAIVYALIKPDGFSSFHVVEKEIKLKKKLFESLV